MGANPSKTESESESKAFPQTINIQHCSPSSSLRGGFKSPTAIHVQNVCFSANNMKELNAKRDNEPEIMCDASRINPPIFFRLNHCWTLSTFYLHWLEGVDWYYRLHLAVYVCNHRGPRRPTSSTATPERLNNFFNCSVAYFIK